MDEFIRQKNIEHYRRLLALTTDEAERKVLLKLLVEEEAKQHTHKQEERGARDT